RALLGLRTRDGREHALLGALAPGLELPSLAAERAEAGAALIELHPRAAERLELVVNRRALQRAYLVQVPHHRRAHGKRDAFPRATDREPAIRAALVPVLIRLVEALHAPVARGEDLALGQPPRASLEHAGEELAQRVLGLARQHRIDEAA